ncbi:hypothetical protein CPC08DRAFT_736978 [Agrocybe pediades]|nr:hypothetical protein CPC08DRAFT_736978 [Agrocybe pediades]
MLLSSLDATLAITLLTLFSSIARAAIIPIRPIRIPGNVHEISVSELRVREHREKRNINYRREDGGEPGSVTTTIYLTLPADSPTSTASISSTPSTIASTSTQNSQPTDSAVPSAASTSSSGASPTQTPIVDSNGTRKYVVAHHMVGNTFPYIIQDWADDIALAHASGIDGFALNMGIDDWQPARVADAYEAAKQSNTDFKMFLSLDMTSLPCASPSDAQNLRSLVNTFVSHPNQLLYGPNNDRAFVSTFSGENCNFGQGSSHDGWRNQFTQSDELKGKIYFVPSFFVDPQTFSDFTDVMDGDFSWNSGWPTQVTTAFAKSQLQQQEQNQQNEKPGLNLLSVVTDAPATSLTDTLEKQLDNAMQSTLSKVQLAVTQFVGSTDTDEEHRKGLQQLSGSLQRRDADDSSDGQKNLTYMGAVSPWFFTHYGPDTYNKNFVYLSDQHLYSKRWDSLIASRDNIDLVQVLTWNDYGESHYVGPIKGALPLNSEKWTTGMNHTKWLELTRYYAQAFKTGTYPAIEKDAIYMWSRPHAANAGGDSSDGVGKPTNFEILQDAVWAIVMANAPATVVLSTSGDDQQQQSFEVPAGVTKLAVPIAPGGTMKGVMTRDGQTVVQLDVSPQEFTFQGEVSDKGYNYNAFVAGATAD